MSSTQSKMGRFTLGLAGLLVVGGAAACGGFGAGDYEVFRISSPEAKLSGDCQNDPDTTSTFYNGATFILYATSGDSDDVYYLDIGTTVLTGATTDDGYSFSGKSTNVQDAGGATITTTTTVTVALTVDGNQCSGTATTVQQSACSGNCDFFDPSKCTSTSTFTGVLLEDTSVNADPGGLGP
ncbi:MAG TPA: hypothetical protein VL400_06310 [Polyangiaceae bacterium]|nr:hypothetical protein [Polyangiaceae bacterium]